MKNMRGRALRAMLLICCLLVINFSSVTASLSAQPPHECKRSVAITTRVQSVSFDPSGNYIFAGKAPKGFENLRWVSVETTEMDLSSFTRRNISPRGSLWAGREFKMASVNLNGYELAFTTRPAAGISYQFSGQFLKRGIYSEIFDSESTEVVLKGRLTKTRRGRKVADSQVGFHWYRGD